MSRSRQIDRAKKARCNEYYTPKETVEDMVAKLGIQLHGKNVWCLADGKDSEFTKVFAREFANLGLKKLTCTSFVKDSHGLALIKDSAESDFKEIQLEGDGDYNSAEVQKLAEDCDVVITNPPFSDMNTTLRYLSFRGCDYCVIAPFYAISELVRFSDFKIPKLYRLKTTEFFVPNSQEYSNAKPYSLDPSRGMSVVISVAMWVTTLDLGPMPTLKFNETPLAELRKQGKIDTYKSYSEQILEIPRLANIPKDTPDDVLLSVPTSILTFDIEASGFELVGTMTNRKISYYTGTYLIFSKFLAFKMSDGKMPWWRVYIQKRGSNAAQKFAERNNIPSYKSQEIEQYYAKYRINKGHNNEN